MCNWPVINILISKCPGKIKKNSYSVLNWKSFAPARTIMYCEKSLLILETLIVQQ